MLDVDANGANGKLEAKIAVCYSVTRSILARVIELLSKYESNSRDVRGKEVYEQNVVVETIFET